MARLAPSIEELTEFEQWLRSIRPTIDSDLIGKILAYEQLEHRCDTDFSDYSEVLSGKADRVWFEFDVPHQESRDSVNRIMHTHGKLAAQLHRAAGAILLVRAAAHQEHSMGEYSAVSSAFHMLLHPRCNFFSCLFSTEAMQTNTASLSCLLIVSGIGYFEPFIGPPRSLQVVEPPIYEIPAFLITKQSLG